MTQTLEQALKDSVKSIPKGLYFDAHTIINKLFENNSDIYLKEYNDTDTAKYHTLISKIIKKSALAEPLNISGEEANIYSKNKSGKYSQNKLYKRI